MTNILFSEAETPAIAIFEGYKIEILGEKQFSDIWYPILKEVGADVVELMFTDQESKVDLFLSGTCK